MKLQEIFTQLSSGELADIHMGGFDFGGIQASDNAMIIAHINLALMELHMRLPIRLNKLLLLLDPNKNQYLLDKRHAKSNPTQGYDKYIEDTAGLDEFKDEVLKIDRIYNSCTGKQLPLNDEHALFAFNTLNANTLQVPIDYPDDNILVSYRASTAYIPEDADISTYEVDVPRMYLLPILYFVGSRVFTNHIDGDGSSNTGVAFMQRFDLAIHNFKQSNLVTHVQEQSDKFHMNGWV